MNRKDINNFIDLDAWQKAHRYVIDIYMVAKELPKEELYGLTSQLKRAAVSITCNIAEGFSRYHFKEKSNFYYTARGSVSEVCNLLLVARDIGFVGKDNSDKLLKDGEDIKMLINGLIRSVDKQLSGN
jgi:four helix bundle protein